MVTLEKLLRIPKLKDLEVIAGESGLKRNIGHVTVMEVPDIIQWLKGDDFLITSLYAVKDDIEAQCNLIKNLARSSCACVAIKTGQYVREISEELKSIADEYSIPLLRIPYAMSYIDIIVNVMNYIFEERNPRVVLEKYIKDIIFEAYTDPDLMIERGNTLGFSVSKWRYLAMTLRFFATSRPSPSDMETLWKTGIVAAQFASTQRGLQHCIAVNTQTNCSIFLDASDEATLVRLLPFVEKEVLTQVDRALPGQRVCIGYGNIGSGLSGIRDTYVNSLHASRIGQIFYPDRQAYHYDDVEMLCVLEKIIEDKKIRLFDDLLGKIGGGELLDTLIAYFGSNNGLEETAWKLFVHKNTVKYRLQRIKKLTGLDVKNFNDAMKLYMAIFARKIQTENTD
ncbi:MAG: PucR family transcriptional regulator ligand-binding domain-containing protein [Synergistaceae bacterium]|jgi:purine catabolism regulator|nr:PucR family transcriptional regulator ligand-binding domain-containing protein [Synergistaceae bacterium]